jgi:large subunit ribosomal protein L35
MKSHRGAAKRLRLTGTGKLRRRHAFDGHMKEGKSRKRKRELGKVTDVHAADERQARRLLAH